MTRGLAAGEAGPADLAEATHGEEPSPQLAATRPDLLREYRAGLAEDAAGCESGCVLPKHSCMYHEMDGGDSCFDRARCVCRCGATRGFPRMQGEGWTKAAERSGA